MLLRYSRTDQRIYVFENDAIVDSFEARNDFFPGYNSEGQPRASLPIGNYLVNAEDPPAEDSNEFGTFYIATGDSRGRDFHGGGSGLDDPKAPRQGWYPTLGCIRMQNEDGETLSNLIIDAGNNIPLEVVE